jgi:hypothetical protein
LPDARLLSGAVADDPAVFSSGERASEISSVKIPAVSRRSRLLTPGFVKPAGVDRGEAEIINEAKDSGLRLRPIADGRERYPPEVSSGNAVLLEAAGED